MNTIIGVFDDAQAARRALEALRDSPLDLDDISIISRDRAASGAGSEDVSAGEGATVGAVWGGLVGLTALLIPGIGPFIAGGALFATLTGAVTGAVVGGIAAGLIDFSGMFSNMDPGNPSGVVRAELQILTSPGYVLLVVGGWIEATPGPDARAANVAASTRKGIE